MSKKTELEFQSEIKQLLHILVFSLYKDREIFLRELISNSVDALNKVQFELLQNRVEEDRELELKIDIKIDKEKKMIVVEDTGIGMTRKELIDNIGTVAHSGTMEFLKKVSKKMKEGDKLDIIGKFGVGFYSVFMVAKEVKIITKSFKINSNGYLWYSEGNEKYTIEKQDKQNRGTRIEIYLKDDAKEFLSEEKIKFIIDKHSKFVPFPIYLNGKKIEKTKPIWSQPKSSLKEKDYKEFYKYISGYDTEPLSYIHISSDAPYQFHALLYFPSTSMEFPNLLKKESGVDLYSRKVLIQKGSADIIPEYLNFLKGIVDSEDIPLNVSRESIQNNLIVNKIKAHIVKKVIEHLGKLKEKNFEKFIKIWDNFERKFKEGIISDYTNKDKLSELLLFNSMNNRDKRIDFNNYIENMKPEQKEIYYIFGENINNIIKNPALEIFEKKGFDVLFLLDPIDEFVLDNLREFKGKKFKMVESADIKLDDKEKGREKERAGDFIKYLKELYKDRVEDVRVSERLVKSPCAIVNPDNTPSVGVEKIMKMMNKDFEFTKKIFEINPKNTLIKSMIELFEKDKKSEKLRELSLQLLDNQLLRAGLLKDVGESVERIYKIMEESLK
jgi:molecular chaperone HtpG